MMMMVMMFEFFHWLFLSIHQHFSLVWVNEADTDACVVKNYEAQRKSKWAKVAPTSS